MNHSLSLSGKKWMIAQQSEADLLTHLLALRGVTQETRTAFLTPDLTLAAHDPALLLDLPKATERIEQAITNQERIFICGDYDVDGVTASALLFRTLRWRGAAVSVRLPHRMRDGYGLNLHMIEEAKEKGVGLIITVDNGISARDAVAKARDAGIDVIITDHHLPPTELPPAYAIVNPKQVNCTYPYKQLSGAGVAWKLALQLVTGRTPPVELTDEILVLATIGTIADVCPLTKENRAMVVAGLRALQRTTNSGLLRILKNAGIERTATATDIGFRVGPRLNAAGRLDSALTAFQALAHETHPEQFADSLEMLNRERQKLSEEILQDAKAKVAARTASILIASSAAWHRGVIGLTAGKLAELFGRPVILMEADGDELVGSCRNPITALNIVELLGEASDLLIGYGGHHAAAGFTLPRAHLAAFTERLEIATAKKLATIDLTPELRCEAEIAESHISTQLVRQLEKLAPFGAANPEPILYLPAAPISELKPVGKDNKHLSFRVGAKKLKAIWFGSGEHLAAIKHRATLDLAVTLSEEYWNGRTSLNLQVIDAR